MQQYRHLALPNFDIERREVCFRYGVPYLPEHFFQILHRAVLCFDLIHHFVHLCIFYQLYFLGDVVHEEN